MPLVPHKITCALLAAGLLTTSRMCIAVSELCLALKDKKNRQLVLNEADAIFSKDRVNGRVMLANL